MDITYTNKISVDDYNNLRKSAGWNEIEKNQALTGINNSMFIISAAVDNKTVGVTRVVGDGGYIAVIVDVIVLPDFQRNGIGKTMMKKAMEFIKSTIKENQCVFVNLMASKDREPFYSQFGFETRPNEKLGAGMTQWIQGDAD
jgi:predicted GNAT family N-acyltransferase